MGVFDDKRYDELDWVSQAVQPIETPLAAILESLPERHKIVYADLAEGDRITIDKSYIINKLVGRKSLSWKENDILYKCFEFWRDGENELILNLEDKTLVGDIYLVKTQFTLDEADLKQILGLEGIEHLGRLSWYDADHKRVNEMLETVEKAEDAIRSRSCKQKRIALTNRLQEIFKNNEWNVKGAELANKVGIWMRNYIETGDLAALSNITRLKVMTYKGAPIYSVEEA